MKEMVAKNNNSLPERLPEPCHYRIFQYLGMRLTSAWVVVNLIMVGLLLHPAARMWPAMPLHDVSETLRRHIGDGTSTVKLTKQQVRPGFPCSSRRQHMRGRAGNQQVSRECDRVGIPYKGAGGYVISL